MGRLLGFILLLLATGNAIAQTCTIVDPDGDPGTSTLVSWVNASSPSCQEGGNAGAASIIIIPAGVLLRFDDGADTWTGTNIQVYGRLGISAAVKISSNIEVLSGGTLAIGNNGKLDMGSAGSNPCPYSVTIQPGGLLDFTGNPVNPSERLRFCNTTIAIPGGGSCQNCPEVSPGVFDCSGIVAPPPICEPVGGFTGPIVLSEDGGASLPVELAFFRASKGINKVSLSWATASELNFNYFEVEKSADGKTFQSIAKVNGHGTTNERHDYALDDEKPYIGKNYYRLKSVDFDGYTEYFNVLRVDFDGSKAFSITPNPSDGITFTAETNFVPDTKAYVAIYSTLGAEIGRYEVSGNKSILTLPVKLESGVYYAKYFSLDFTATNRVLVK